MTPWLLILLSFLSGSIPFGFLVGRLRGIDIRKEGSGNIGATNALRVLGPGWGVCVLIADIIKGYVPTYLAFNIQQAFLPQDAFIVLVGLAAILGHTFTPFLKFKGGKGVATSTGVLLAMMPVALGITAVVWGLICFSSRYVSLASILAVVLMPILAAVFHRDQIWFIAVAVAIGIVIILRHRANIKRLREGTENRFGGKKK